MRRASAQILRQAKSRAARGIVGTVGLRGVSSVAAFVVTLVLARLLGPAGLGDYSFVVAWIYLLLLPANLGANQLIVREIPRFLHDDDPHLGGGLIRWGRRAALLASLGLAALVVGLAWLLPGVADERRILFTLGAPLLPLLASMRIDQAVMQAFRRPTSSLVPELLLRPVLFVGLVLVVALAARETVSTRFALTAYLATGAVATVVNRTMANAAVRATWTVTAPLRSRGRAWLRAALPLLAVSSLKVVYLNTDIVMLGALATSEATGIYRVVSKAAEAIAIPMLAAGAVLAPTFSARREDHDGLQRSFTRGTRLVFALSLLAATALIVFRAPFLGLFGPEFVAGSTAVVLLASAQLFNAAVGPVEIALVMTGFSRAALLQIGASVTLNVALNALLIPRWGFEGAAVATAVSIVTWNVLLGAQVVRKVGIVPGLLPLRVGRGVRPRRRS